METIEFARSIWYRDFSTEFYYHSLDYSKWREFLAAYDEMLRTALASLFVRLSVRLSA